MVSKKDAESFPAYPVFADSISPELANAVRPKNATFDLAFLPYIISNFSPLVERLYCIQVPREELSTSFRPVEFPIRTVGT